MSPVYKDVIKSIGITIIYKHQALPIYYNSPALTVGNYFVLWCQYYVRVAITYFMIDTFSYKDFYRLTGIPS